MSQANLSAEGHKVDTSLDNVVIISTLERSGAVALDITGYTLPYVRAGHVIIRDQQGTKAYKPMPVNGEANAYASLPERHDVVGVALSSTLAGRELTTILVRGSVNAVASPFALTDEIKRALPLIRFTSDK